MTELTLNDLPVPPAALKTLEKLAPLYPAYFRDNNISREELLSILNPNKDERFASSADAEYLSSKMKGKVTTGDLMKLLAEMSGMGAERNETLVVTNPPKEPASPQPLS